MITNGKNIRAFLSLIIAGGVQICSQCRTCQAAPSPSASNSLSTNSRAAIARNGVDVLAANRFVALKKLRLGLITNHSGVDSSRNPSIDLLNKTEDLHLVCLFSPEHGIRGELDEKVGDGTDAKTGLPIYSLYGERRSPTPEQLQGLDALVYDIQDIGCRFYTYISTLGLCMEAASKADIKFIVLDRVNPITGMEVEGPVYHGAPNFVAFHAIPLRHGMTVGELAKMFRDERGWNLDLSVIPVEGWSRNKWFDATGLPWINPSPNMRSLVEATTYPGVGLLEMAVSVGRGTGFPFELVGAPYVEDVLLASELNAAGLPGVRFIPVKFTPTYSVFKDKPCGGVNILITDRESFKSVDLGIVLIQTFYRLYPKDFALEKVLTLLKDNDILQAIKAGKSLQEIKNMWHDDLESFKARRQKYLIYSHN